MLHLSTQDVVLSIENTPVTKFNGFVYQEYNNFFGKTFMKKSFKKSSFWLEHDHGGNVMIIDKSI